MGNQLSHYFIEDDSLPPDIQTFPYYFGAEKFMFTSDAGMFSPGHVMRPPPSCCTRCQSEPAFFGFGVRLLA